MSAFDITGLVVGGVLAVLFAWGAARDTQQRGATSFEQFLALLICTAWAVFCFARLCGATL
ncbi:hypothetical protein [Caulobacter phage KcrB]|nr:hypothetical protein RW_GP027 [Caulobacter phage RW]WCA46331.1 hypothetical protein [Caulobacter phage KcrB]WCD56266.1 hypothetical protein [Caulobacter phage RLK]WNV48058.1 hypothetical protein GB2A_gp026 [Caulobacter phage GB2A]